MVSFSGPQLTFLHLQTEKFSGVAGETPSNPSVPVAVGSGPGRGDVDSHASMKSLLTSKPEDTTHSRRSRGGTCGCWGNGLCFGATLA